jgi:hypothetical protein
VPLQGLLEESHVMVAAAYAVDMKGVVESNITRVVMTTVEITVIPPRLKLIILWLPIKAHI